jgi:hypothetical protein
MTHSSDFLPLLLLGLTVACAGSRGSSAGEARSAEKAESGAAASGGAGSSPESTAARGPSWSEYSSRVLAEQEAARVREAGEERPGAESNGRFATQHEFCTAFLFEELKEKAWAGERCELALLGNGSTLLFTVVEECGGDSCSTRSWVRTRAQAEWLSLGSELGGHVEALVDGSALIVDTLTSLGVPGGLEVDPLGGRSEVILSRIALPGLERTPFASCTSPRLSPEGSFLLCRDREGNVLRVRSDGGKPELYALSGRAPAEVPYVPYAYVWPEQVEFPTAGELRFERPMRRPPSAAPAPAEPASELEHVTIPWSPAPLAAPHQPPRPPAPEPVLFEKHYPAAASFPLGEYLREKKLKGPGFEQTCWELPPRVGVPPAPGLLCLVSPENQPLTVARIYRVEAGRLTEVFDAIIGAWANWLALVPLLHEDGTVELSDQRPFQCQHAVQGEYAMKVAAGVAPPGGEYLEAGCAKVGHYRFERGRYRLSGPPPQNDAAFP